MTPLLMVTTVGLGLVRRLINATNDDAHTTWTLDIATSYKALGLCSTTRARLGAL